MKIVVTIILMLVWFELVAEGVSFLVFQKGIVRYGIVPWDLTGAPYGVSLFMGVLHLLFPLYMLYMCYIQWRDYGCNISEWFKPEQKKEKYFYINIDLLKMDDYVWRDELKNKEKLIAYSKDGVNAAKKKAIELGLKGCFIDFKSKEEVEKEREW